MYKNLFALFAVLIFFNSARAQQSINGSVTDNKGKALPYVNIGIKGGNIGTVSKQDGQFTLSIPKEVLPDSIAFSCSGFQEQSRLANDLVKEDKIQVIMSEKVETLNEVKISNAKRKIRRLGITGRTPLVYVPSTRWKSTDIIEQARLIHLKSPAKILNANIFMLSEEDREVMIRINIYGFKDGMPAERLVEKNIIKRAILKKGWFSVDLSKEHVYLDEDFVISFEYLPDDKRNGKPIMFGAKLGASDSWLRSSSLGAWRKNELGGSSIYVTVEI